MQSPYSDWKSSAAGLVPQPEILALQLLFVYIGPVQDLLNQADLPQVSPAQWDAVVRVSLEHKVAPLLYQRLKNANHLFLLPEELQRRLQEAYRRSILNNTRIFQVLDDILESFGQSSIPVILLKGIYLAEKIYGNIGLRPMTDIDLLVARQQVSQALRVLQSLGYCPLYLPHSEADYHEMHALTLVDKTNGGSIDLHWTLLPPATPFTIPVEQIWQSAQQDSSRKPTVLALSAEDLLLHLCLHAVYLDRLSSGLRPFCDIAWTVNALQDQIDWQKFIQSASEWGAARSAWLGLMLAVRLLQAPVPGEVLDRLYLPDEDDLTRVDWAIAQVLKPVEMGGKLAAVWAPNSLGRRAAIFAHLLFPAPYEMRTVHPRLARGLLWPLAYLRQLGLVIRRNWGATWRLLRGESRIQAAAIRSEQVNKLVQWQESRPQ